MKSIALRPWELAAYRREKNLLVVRPVKPQPPEGWSPIACEEYRPLVPDADGMAVEASESIFGAYDEDWGTKCPFGKPGKVLGIKEAGQWEAAEFDHTLCGTTPVMTARIRYAADGCPKPWRPAQHMPPWAIRHRPTIADIRVMRVGEMTAQEAWDAGARCECMVPVPQCKGNLEAFMEHWNKHYPTLSWGWGIFLEGT